MTFEPPKLQGEISCACTCAPSDGDSTVETTMPAQLTVLGYILGSVWPPNSLFNKFRRLCHRNEAHYSGLAGYHGRPKHWMVQCNPQ